MSTREKRIMLSIILAGILSLPGLLVMVVMIPIITLLMLPALVLLLARKGEKGGNEVLKADKGRRIIITGGSSGIGKSIALESAKRNDVTEIVILARNKTRLEAAQKEIENVIDSKKKIQVRSVSTDITDTKALAEAAKTIFANKKMAVTHLFCCAGESYAECFEKVSSDVFAKLCNVNQLGSIYTAQQMIPYMEAGTITFCSSMAGQVGVFGYTSYSPTKFALRGFAECLHMELLNTPIHVQVAYPPDTNTPGFEKENEIKPAETQAISESTALAQPDEIGCIMLQKAITKNPPFNVYFNFDGFLLCSLASGFSPVTTLIDAAGQVAAMSLVRVVSLFYLKDWHRTILACQANRSKETKETSETEPDKDDAKTKSS